MGTLSKENFWDAVYEKYPVQVQMFYDWIDDYKKSVNWRDLFKPIKRGTVLVSIPKYHEIPIAMQFGIFLEYISALGLEESVKVPKYNKGTAEIIDNFFFHQYYNAKKMEITTKPVYTTPLKITKFFLIAFTLFSLSASSQARIATDGNYYKKDTVKLTYTATDKSYFDGLEYHQLFINRKGQLIYFVKQTKKVLKVIPGDTLKLKHPY